MNQAKPVTIGIMGGSAAGKSTLAKKLADRLSAFSPIVLNQDHYFRDFSEYSPEEREKVITANHPDVVLWDQLIDHLQRLSDRQSIQTPAAGTRMAQRQETVEIIEPSDLVILEGHLIFWSQKIRDLLQIKLYLEVDPHERVLRRMLRDVSDRGGDLKWQIDWYRRDVIPNYPTYTEPCKKYADLIVPFDRENGVATEMVIAGLLNQLTARS